MLPVCFPREVLSHDIGEHQEKKIYVATRRRVSNVGSVETYCRKQFTVKTHSTHHCSSYAKFPFKRYILRVVHYLRKVPSQLPFERYVRHGIYYPRKVASQLPFGRYIRHGVPIHAKYLRIFCSDDTSGMASLSTHGIFATSVWMTPLPQYRLSTQSTFATSIRTLRLAGCLLSTQSRFVTSVGT